MTPIAAALMIALGVGTQLSAHAQDPLDRTVLPIAEPKRPVILELDARNVQPPPHFEVKAPVGAPNVIIVLIDDLGFGASSTFGGPIQTPTLDGLAENGLRYTNFHTTALSSPTRAAIKSGRNHHTVNMGFITEMATSLPGATGQIPNATAPLAETLRLNGYSTAAFGKWHETATWETSVSGPFDRWPTRQGFDKFYGFIGGETNQWVPSLFDGVASVELPHDPSYHFMTDMTDKAVAWIGYQKAMTPDKPFFVYFAPGATHAPHHVPEEWIARWKGKFDQGWDRIREQTLARQIKMGVVPPGTKLAPKPPAIKDWDKLSDIEGVSMAYTFHDANARDRHTTQYFEIAGNRAIYHDGWLARTIHRAPWELNPRRPLKDDVWELYDVRSDFSLADDLAAKNPTKLAEMQVLFMQEAEKHHVLPIDDRVFERALAEAVGRPDLMSGRTSLTLAEGMTGMMENVFLNVKNKSKTITADIEVPASGANGTIIAQGGRFGGWSLYVKDGVPAYDYNFLSSTRRP